MVLGGATVAGALMTGVSIQYLAPDEPQQTITDVAAPDTTPDETAPTTELSVGVQNDAAATQEAPATSAAESTSIGQAPDVPTLDIVRVEGDGSALVAGVARPNSTVVLELDGKRLDTVQSGADGGFVAFPQLPDLGSASSLRVATVDEEEATYAGETVLILPPSNPAVRPVLVVADADGADIIQPEDVQAAPEITATDDTAPILRELALETISYDDTGDVVISGLGAGQQFVRVYVNNEPQQTEVVPDDGSWRVVLPDVDAGTYTLRVDQIDAKGEVMARVESPFRRTSRADVVEAKTTSVTVQPGHTLWVLAEQRYGDGVKYVQIFKANRDRIRDADLIYPGQIFDLPTE